MELIVRSAERQRVVEATERLVAASTHGRRVLAGEPDHRVREFRDEVLGRAHELVQDMGHELERFLRRLVGALDRFKEEHLLVGISGVRVAETKWLTDGQLQIRFTVDRPQPPDPEMFHAVVDPFVDEVLEGFDLPADFRAELAGMLKGLMLQFAVIKKHTRLDLRRVTFDDWRWVTPQTLRLYVKQGGQVLTPKDIGWD